MIGRFRLRFGRCRRVHSTGGPRNIKLYINFDRKYVSTGKRREKPTKFYTDRIGTTSCVDLGKSVCSSI